MLPYCSLVVVIHVRATDIGSSGGAAAAAAAAGVSGEAFGLFYVGLPANAGGGRTVAAALSQGGAMLCEYLPQDVWVVVAPGRGALAPAEALGAVVVSEADHCCSRLVLVREGSSPGLLGGGVDDVGRGSTQPQMTCGQ